MITIICGLPGSGKTLLLTHILNTASFDYDRTDRINEEIYIKNQGGFNLNPIEHCVASNYNITFQQFGCEPMKTNIINPYRLGYLNKWVRTHYLAPGSVIGITEAQKYLNSRMSAYFPDWQSRWYEQHRHNDYDIYLDCQRPELIDLNVRMLSAFIEIQKVNFEYNAYGEISKCIWIVRKFENHKEYNEYFSTNGKIGTYTETQIFADYNVTELYDSQNCKPKFYNGHFEEDFDNNQINSVEDNIESYIKYLELTDDELPDKFYKKSV